MGLAASQARYLALTARKSDLEFQSQTINTRRIQLAYRTSEIAQAYTEGMNNKRISISSTNKNGDTIWKEATFGNLLSAGYVVIPICGEKWGDISLGQDSPYRSKGSPTEVQSGYYKVSSSYANSAFTLEEIASTFNGNTAVTDKSDIVKNYFNKQEDGTYKLKATFVESDTQKYDNLPASMKTKNVYEAIPPIQTYPIDVNGGYNDNSDSKNLEALLVKGYCQIVTKGFFDYLCQNGYSINDNKNSMTRAKYYDLLEKYQQNENDINPSNQATEVDWRADETETFSQRSYTDDDAAVLAKYERDTAEVQAQDKILEAQEKNIETQHKAIETELESIQKVIQNNIEKTFKIFS